MFATPEDIRNGTAFAEIKELPDNQLTAYIKRAGRWIRHATHADYSDETDEGIQEDLKTAVILLVDYLWYWDDPDNREIIMGSVDNEQIGSYRIQHKNLTTFTKAAEGGKTGITELDEIIKFLTVPVSVNFFSVSGPNDRRRCR